MAFDRQQIYVQCTGQIGTGGGAGEEIFSFGFHCTGLVGFDAAAVLGGLDTAALAALVGDYFSENNTQINDRAHLYSVKFSALGTNGHVISGADPVIEEPAPGGVSGSQSSPDYPNQIAIAVSLRTATNIGLATKGRFYLPCPAMTITNDGRINSTSPGLLATSTKDFLDAFNTEMDGDALVSLMSEVGSGATRGVTRVLVGDVLDTIRNRRNALQESYVSEDLA